MLRVAAGLGCLAGVIAPLRAQEVDHSRMEHAQAGQEDEHQHEVEAGHEHEHITAGAGARGQQPQTPVPALSESDRAAARPPSTRHVAADDDIYSYTLVERAEAWRMDDRKGLGWEAGGWIGGDTNRLWWRTEGELTDGRIDAASLEALIGHSFAPRWDLVAGLRQDFRPREARSFVAFGVAGLAPQWFEVAALAYAGEGGRTAARFSTDYSLLVTNRLVLQPVVHIELHGKDDASRGIGSGLSTVEAGLRLRYEFTRQFTPYVGLAWERAFGRTADLRRASGEFVGETRLVAGLRLWF
jgi:copper resistance protein B